MHYGRRSDLALEAKELFESSAGKTTQLSGVRAREETLFGYPLTRVDILDETGAEALGKPVGTYLTLEFPALPQGREELLRAARAVAALLGQLPGLPDTGPVFVAGLGNRQMTPDAIGPAAVENLLVTRHMVRTLPRQFRGFTPVSALCTGVLARTGLETLELIQGAAAHIRPTAVIAIDALAARSRDRLCATVQLSDTGLTPGSGVGNHRRAVDRAALGVPVIAVGVPTVIDGATLCADLLEEAGCPRQALCGRGADLFVTPQDIDQRVTELGRTVDVRLDVTDGGRLADGDVLAIDRSGVVPVAVVVRLRSAEVYLVEVDRMDPIALAHACWEIGNMHAPLFRGDSDEHTVRMYTPVQPVLGRMLRGVEGVRLSLVTRELDADRRFASSAAEVVVSMAPDFTIVKKARG